MSPRNLSLLVSGVAAVLLSGGIHSLAVGQSASQDVIGELADNQGIFVDGKTFKIVRGAAKGDPQAQIAKSGAREVSDGAIIFRSGEKLYIVDGRPPQ